MKRGMWWPIGVSAILATTVAANIWVAAIASDDPSFAIEHDYYKKAVAWDSTLAQARTNATLGWRLTPAFDAIAADGRATVRATLTDSAGAPIAGATVRVSAAHLARANDVRELTLASSAAGIYDAQLDAPIPGQWELRFEVTAGTTRFTNVARVDVGLAR